MLKKYVAFLLILISHLTTSHTFADDELYVLLGSENALLPICVSDCDHSKTTLSKDYLQSLTEILNFDLSHNGMTNAILGKDRAKILGKQPKSSNDTPNLDLLKDGDVSYYVQTGCVDKLLSAKLYSVQSNTLQKVEAVLTGEALHDRAIIHQLSDAIFQALFNKPGITNSKILFTVKKRSGPQAGSSELYICDYDGQNANRIATSNTLITTSQWIPSHKGSFLYVSYEIGQPKMYFNSIKSGKVTEKARRVTPMRGNQLTPAISPDSKLIAFASDFTGTADLFLVPFQYEVGSIGKPRHLYAAKGAACASPTFSPDSKQIAFVCNKDGSPKIYVMNVPEPTAHLKSLQPRLITKYNRENSAPVWSPNGKMLAYSAKNGGERQIWIYDFETGKEKQLTRGAGNKENPSWAANSLHLIYNSSGSKNELFLINLNRPEPTRIVSCPDDVQFAVFEPSMR